LIIGQYLTSYKAYKNVPIFWATCISMNLSDYLRLLFNGSFMVR